MNVKALRFKKSHLSRKYFWTVPQDNHAFIGPPDQSTFHRRQGWDILYLANFLFENNHLKSEISLSEVEEVIALKMPIGVTTQLDAMDWICGYFGCL